MKYFGGVEGGATHSRLVICNESGECCATTTGPGTNHWTLGIPECARRIADMVAQAKHEAGINQNTRLTSLGLSLSGCEQEATNCELEKEMRSNYPDVADSYVVSSDTLGSVYTASPKGGMVVISGTGSNALLRNPDGSTYTCGGWGHFIGDEGGAWYISYRALKIVFDDMDNFEKSAYPIQRTWELIKEHFNVQTRLDLLPHCYAKFDKPFFASLCQKLAKAAEEGDQLAANLFKEAGQFIGRSINALLPMVHKDLVESDDLTIVCAGSVWLSFPLLREGFLKEINKNSFKFGLKLVRITKTMAYGACYLAADAIEHNLPRITDNFTVLFHYKGNSPVMNGNIQNGNCNGS